MNAKWGKKTINFDEAGESTRDREREGERKSGFVYGEVVNE